MHLLLAQPGEVSDGSEAVDLGQSPADVIIISAADTELAALAEARAELADAAPTLRLASLLHLSHPMSVDLYLDQTATKSRLVIARVLGGEGYWAYGIEQFAARLGEAGIKFAALPGDDKPDEALRRVSTVSEADWQALWSYFVEGGPENSVNLLRCAQSIIDNTERPAPAKPLLRAGVYWPASGITDLSVIEKHWKDGAPVAAIVFYRALVQGAGLNPINRMVRALMQAGLNPLPVFVASLKDEVSAATLAALFDDAPPAVVLNGTGFAVSSPQSAEHKATPLDAPGVPVFQMVFSGGTEEMWTNGLNGLSARDIAMNVALPEIDGRVLTRAVSFKSEAYFDEATECRIATYRAQGDRIAFVAQLAANWAKLGRKYNSEKRVAVLLANYPNKDGRLANGVGLDTPQSCVDLLLYLGGAGYQIDGAPDSSADLMEQVQAGPTNWLADRATRNGGERLSLADYKTFYKTLPWDLRLRVEDRWGAAEADPFVGEDGFALSILHFGNAVVGIQPARGYNVDPKETYHAPDLVPPHNYLAFYAWLRKSFMADAIIHLGKHGNLEWLPGKALALSEECFPEAALGPTPHLYPFIVNDPGEGTQAKRRTSAVIIDHLTPPLTRAETYGPLKDLEALVDEYYEASGLDPRRLDHLRREIRSLTAASGLDEDVGITSDTPEEDAFAKLDEYLCELKEAQIRDGLHIFGTAPQGRLETDLLVALARVPRGKGQGRDASIIRALAADLLPSLDFDPLDCNLSSKWTGERPACLAGLSSDPWRSIGDTVERLELMAANLVSADGPQTVCEDGMAGPVLNWIRDTMRPALEQCGPNEFNATLQGLNARFVPPGPSGAPTRGRPDVLPTGRNFFSVDSRAVPTPAAYALGWASASLLIETHMQKQGDWLRSVILTAWGTANMRTGGDDIAQGLALMGVRPTWDGANRRVTGFEIIPSDILDRPRVDVTLRVSGFFRDAFPAQMDLFDSAARAVMALDESAEVNPLAARFRADGETREAGFRVFGSKPGAYGAGLQAMIDEKLWAERSDLAESYLEWGSYAYGGGTMGDQVRDTFETRLSMVEAVVQNQDNREHDLLDSDDYYQFEGGAAAAVATLSGSEPTIYHNDHSRPERPVIRTLEDEIGRVIRSRVINPKWIAGVKRHGYKGAFEIAATVDYLFAFAATTRAVKQRHFDLVFDAVLADDATRDFIEGANPAALREIADRFAEARDRGMWNPRSNSATRLLDNLRGIPEA